MTPNEERSTTPASELMDLTGRTAIVTGGAAGIGHGIVRRLHEGGANVVIADRDGSAAEDAAAALRAARSESALGVEADVCDEASVAGAIDAAVRTFGGVDILVNNAGIYPVAPLAELDAATFRRVLDVNLVGVFTCTKAVAAQMLAQGRGGRIINITTIDTIRPSMTGMSHYDASKHGILGFTRNIALELAPHGITVNALAPGAIATPGAGELDEAAIREREAVIPLGRLGGPDDIGRVALFLSSGLADYITGAQIVVDGGRLLN